MLDPDGNASTSAVSPPRFDRSGDAGSFGCCGISIRRYRNGGGFILGFLFGCALLFGGGLLGRRGCTAWVTSGLRAAGTEEHGAGWLGAGGGGGAWARPGTSSEGVTKLSYISLGLGSASRGVSGRVLRRFERPPWALVEKGRGLGCEELGCACGSSG